MKRQRIVLRFDGLFKQVNRLEGGGRTAGFLCYGWIITRNGKIIGRGHGGYARWQDANSNVAEYLALIEGLEALLDMGVEAESLHIMGDAKSIIDQMQGKAGINAPRIKPLYQRAQRLSRHFRDINWVWTPRKDNRAADYLTRRALKQIRADRSNYEAALEKLAVGKSKQPTLFMRLLDLRIYQPTANVELAL